MAALIIAQIVLDNASQYERKCQRIDAEVLAGAGHTVTGDAEAAQIVHVYAGRTLPVMKLKRPFVANVAPRNKKFSFRRAVNPAATVTPFNVPEAVEERYFANRSNEAPPVIGSFARPSIQSMIEQTMHRIDRFRDDVQWLLFSHVPSPEEIASVGAWIDPAVDEDDYDGFVAEAIACGVGVVASATPINVQRLENGRSGFLVPPRDPNEMTHAILAALFKPEAARARSEAARQTVGKYRAIQRMRALTRIYESIVQ
jgi:hypothetical protein